MHSSGAGPLRHATAVAIGYGLLFSWLFSGPIAHGTYMAEGDLYDWFLPIFLSPISAWSHDMFGGLPLVADTSDSQAYVVHFLFAHVFHAWIGYIISAYVLGSAFTYAYVYTLTRSKTAAAFSGLAFGLSHAMLEKQAQINIVHCTAWFPLMALAVDRVITGTGSPPRWMAIGAFAIANGFLAGHPQSILYAVTFCAIYAIAGGVAERADRARYLRAMGMLALGMALTAIKSIPFVEVSRFMARTDVSYQWFITPAPTAAEVIAGLFNPPRAEVSQSVSLYVGLIVLALACAGACSRRFAWRARVWAAAAVFCVLLVAGDATPVASLVYQLPLWSRFRIIARILFIFACATAVLAGFALAALQRRARRPAVFTGVAAAMCVVTAVDLLAHVKYRVTAGGLDVTTMAREYAQPSVHARALAERLAPTQQRLLSVDGSSRDDTVPSGFSRVWRIPMAGGYSPIMSARLAALAHMGSPGDVYPQVLASGDRSLDLLAVRDIIVHDDDFLAASTTNLDFAIGRSDCTSPYERQASFDLPADVEVSSIALAMHLRCADDIAHAMKVADLTISSPQGVLATRPLLAGTDIRFAGDTQDVTLRIDLPHAVRGARMSIRVAPMRGWLTLDRMTLVDGSGGSHPQTLGPLLLANTDRWRMVRAYRTSRTTDRRVDDDVPGESAYHVYENLHALPRIWIASSAVELPEAEAINTIRYSQLPDGRPFDPRTTVLLDPGSGGRPYPAGGGDAQLTSIEDTRMTANVSTANGGYLVVSEAHYPGWRATIDGNAATVERVDVMFQGVRVPPGRHIVTFVFASTTFRAGAAISLIALIIAVVLGSTTASRAGRTAHASAHRARELRSPGV